MVRRNRSESRAGQLLAEIEPPEVDQELNQASPELLHSGSSYNDVAGQQRAQSYQTATPPAGNHRKGRDRRRQSSAQHASSEGFGRGGESSASLNPHKTKVQYSAEL